jgi:hypothetical protein
MSYLCPVPANMSFDSHLVVSHVVVTAILSSGGLRLLRDSRSGFPLEPHGCFWQHVVPQEATDTMTETGHRLLAFTGTVNVRVCSSADCLTAMTRYLNSRRARGGLTDEQVHEACTC